MKQWFRKIVAFMAKITPKVEVFGLEINDGLIRFYSLKNNKKKDSEQIELRLPPGAVVGGRVANKEALTSALMELHKRLIDNHRKSISVVLSIPATNIYIQPFDLPIMASSNLAESAELNMRMISPISIDDAYHDWQKLSEGSDHIDMMGAFVTKDIADDFAESVQQAGFSVAALEFVTLSLVRGASVQGLTNEDQPALIIQADQGGFSFAISYRGNLYFHHFTGWDRYRGDDKTISVPKFKDGVVDEVRRTINFFSSNTKVAEITEVVLIASSFSKEITEVIKENFSGINVNTVDFNQLNAAMGAAFRGQGVRSQDTAISLAGVSAVEVFRKNQLFNFISIWRNVLFAVFGLLLFVFLGSAITLQRAGADIVERDPFQVDAENSAELVVLERQAENFNTLVSALRDITVVQDELHFLLERITLNMGTNINLQELSLGEDGELIIQGVSESEERISSFRERMRQDPTFDNVQLPLDLFRTNPDGTITFTLIANLVE